MKKVFISLSVLAGFVFYLGCSPEKPIVFGQKTGIYFGAALDSMNYSFAKYPKRYIDTIKVPVKVLGDPLSTNVTFTLEALTGPDLTAIEGKHYKILNPYTLPAGQLETSVPIVIYRTPDMDTTVLPFKVKLNGNEQLETAVVTKSTYLVKLAYLQKPSNWGTWTGLQFAGHKNYFGTWTKTKYKLILDALYDPVSDTTVTEFPYSSTLSQQPAIAGLYLQLVKNYIKVNYPGNLSGIATEPTLTDPEVKDPTTGKPIVIKVGIANY